MAEVTTWLGCFIFVQLLMVILLVVLLVYILGFRKCDDSAVVKIDTRFDPNNCGIIGRSCAGGQVCSGGVCLCTGGSTLLSGNCVNVQTDPQNCGGSGITCGPNQVCSSGACVTVVTNGPFIANSPANIEPFSQIQTDPKTFSGFSPEVSSSASAVTRKTTASSSSASASSSASSASSSASGNTPLSRRVKTQLTRLTPEQRCQAPNLWCPFSNECVGNYLSNRYHCGNCNKVCSVDEDCIEGVCVRRDKIDRPPCSSCAGGIGRALQFE